MQPMITIGQNTVRQLNGLFSLNDLHRLSGNKPKDRPQLFLRSQKAKDLLAELENEQNYDAQKCAPYICFVTGKGQQQGTYACEEIACAYAMWISAAFHILVIRAFLRLSTFTYRINVQTKQVQDMKDHLSHCGYDLNVHGKQTLPAMKRELQTLIDNQQLMIAGL